MAVVKNLLVRCGADFSGLTRATKKAQANMSAMQRTALALKSTMRTVGVTLSVAAIANFGQACTQAASDLQEVQNVVDVTFGEMSSRVDDFSRGAITSFGLSETATKRYAGTMGAMLKSMGLAPGIVTDMSLSLAGLTGDMASFYNLRPEVAFEKLRSGISGEAEPLKQLGINMSIANLEAFALSQGITRSWQSMTQAEQAMLRYNYIMQATGDAQGDFARTSGSWANQSRLLAEQFNQLKTILGQGLIQALTPVLTVINQLMARLVSLANTFSAVTAALFGKQTAVASDNAEVVESAATAQYDLAGGIAAAGKAAKQSLAGFDELNVLQKDSGTGSTSGGTGAVPDLSIPEIQAPEIEMPEVEIGALQKSLEPLKKLFDGLAAGLEKIGGMSGLVAGVAGAFGLWKVIGFANYVKYIGALIKTTGWAALGNAVLHVGTKAFTTLKSGVLGAVGAAKTMAVTIAGQIKNFVLLAAELVKQAVLWTAHTAKLMLSKAAQLAMTAATLAWNAACAAASVVTAAFGAAVAFLTSPIGVVVVAIAALIAVVALLVTHCDQVKAAASTCWGHVQAVFGGAKKWFEDKLLVPMTEGFKSFANGLIGFVESFVNFFIRGINKVIDCANKLSFTIPDWVPEVGGGTFGINIKPVAPLSLPRLARGGIVDGATMATIGEAGREAVLPLENNTDWMDALAQRIGGDIIIKASGEAGLLKYLNLKLEKESSRRGKNLVVGGAF